MDKKQMSEEDIKFRFISPALEGCGWSKKQVRMNVYFTDGRIIVAGKTVKRGKRNFADYILEYKPNKPLAVIEAKDNNHSVGEGMQQAIEYADKLDLPFVFSSNGDGFLFHDKTTGKEIKLDINNFPTPKELWDKYNAYKGITEKIEDTINSDYYYEPGFKQPRYYQRIAINRTVEAIAKGQKRALLVLATGTGKTYVAFQTIWRLRQSGRAKRVLYLADRNILIDQPKNNDLKPLSKVITKVSNRKADPSYEVYLALYQAVSGEDEIKNIYKQFSQDFFDLIIVDECHRGSAKEESQWREILL